VDVFTRITGAGGVPEELRSALEGDALRVFCNAELAYRLRGVTARAATRWEVSSPPGGGDTSRLVLRGRAATIHVEMSEETGFRRRVVVETRQHRQTAASCPHPGRGVAGRAGPRSGRRARLDVPRRST
jgi:hypothetical protein